MTIEHRGQQLAQFISGLRYEHIPVDVLEKAKQLVMDIVRLSIVGSRLPWGEYTREVFLQMGGREESTVLGFGDRLPAIHAAYVNGVTAHGLENDDTHAGALLHPGVAVVPTVLAVAEREGLGGKELLAGMVAGYEIMIRIGIMMQPSLLNDRGFHATSVCGHFGAAAGAANLLGLSADKTAHALAFAASYASGLANWLSGGMVKAIHAGKAAKAGIEAALLAAAGITGPRQIFEGKYGFCNAYAGQYNMDAMTAGLRKEWKTLEIHLKPHATTRNIQSAIEATGIIASEYNIHSNDVEFVEVRTSPGILAESEITIAPVDVIEAQSSFPIAVATALFKGGTKTLKEFVLFDDLIQAMRNPGLLSLARRVQVVQDPTLVWQKFSSEVTIRLKNGKSHTKRVDVMRGSPDNPFTKQEVLDRYLSQAASVVSKERLIKAAKAIERLEEVKKIEEVTTLLH